MRIIACLLIAAASIFTGCEEAVNKHDNSADQKDAIAKRDASERGETNNGNGQINGNSSHKRSDKKPPSVHRDATSLEVVAFGDWGTNNRMMNQAMATFNSKFPKVDTVFLLGDNFYSDHEVNTFDLFTKHVAPLGTNRAHYVVLGNHDYLHGLQKQLTYNQQDPRWILPSKYYFKRFKLNGFDVCVWFLDTEGILKQGDKAQIPWLDASLNVEGPTCKWKLVNGHHPLMHASPIPGQCPGPLFQIKPILGEHKVHIYLSGHHHNTQFMQHQPSGVYYAIVGGIVEQRSAPDPNKFAVKGRNYIWGTGTTSAVMRLLIDANSLTVEFHSGTNPNQPVLYSHIIL